MGGIAIPGPAWRTVALAVGLCIAALGLAIRFCRCGRSVGGRAARAERRRDPAQVTRRTVAPARMARGISATWSTTSSR